MLAGVDLLEQGEPLSGSAITEGFSLILPFYTFLPRFGGKIMSELK